MSTQTVKKHSIRPTRRRRPNACKKQRRHSTGGYPMGKIMPTIMDAAEEPKVLPVMKVHDKQSRSLQRAQSFKAQSLTQSSGSLEYTAPLHEKIAHYKPSSKIAPDLHPTQYRPSSSISQASFVSAMGGDQSSPITKKRRRSSGGGSVGSVSTISIFEDNSEAGKLFGKHVGDEAGFEEEEDEDTIITMGRCIVLPSRLWRIMWDMQLVVFLVYIAVMTPIRMAFGTAETWLPANMPGVFIVDLVADVFFLVDIVLNFCTANYDKYGILETRRWAIARRYLRGFFLIDIISAIPWSLAAAIHMLFGVDMGASDLVTVINILKLFKISKLWNAMRNLSYARSEKMRAIGAIIKEFFQLHHALKNILITFIGVLFMVHLNACLFGVLAKLTPASEYHTWMTAAEITQQSWYQQYANALYWSVTTITTVGYGDIVPVSAFERAYCIVSVFIGAVVWSSIISTFVASAAAANLRKNQVNEKMDSIAMYMRMKRYPDELFTKVFAYYHHYYEKKSGIDEGQILGQLSDKLRVQVSAFMAQSTFHSNVLFKGFDDKFLTVVMLTTKPLCVQTDEVVFSCGDAGNEMFVVCAGKLEAQHKTDFRGVAINTMRKHTNFGEQCIFDLAESRSSTVKAMQITELLSIWGEDIQKTLAKVAPHMLIELRRRVRKKYRRMARHRKKILAGLVRRSTSARRVELSKSSSIMENLKRALYGAGAAIGIEHARAGPYQVSPPLGNTRASPKASPKVLARQTTIAGSSIEAFEFDSVISSASIAEVVPTSRKHGIPTASSMPRSRSSQQQGEVEMSAIRKRSITAPILIPKMNEGPFQESSGQEEPTMPSGMHSEYDSADDRESKMAHKSDNGSNVDVLLQTLSRNISHLSSSSSRYTNDFIPDQTPRRNASFLSRGSAGAGRRGAPLSLEHDRSDPTLMMRFTQLENLVMQLGRELSDHAAQSRESARSTNHAVQQMQAHVDGFTFRVEEKLSKIQTALAAKT